MDERFQYYLADAGLSGNKQGRAVLRHFIGPAGQEYFHTLSDTGANYKSVIGSLDIYFMLEKSLI